MFLTIFFENPFQFFDIYIAFKGHITFNFQRIIRVYLKNFATVQLHVLFCSGEMVIHRNNIFFFYKHLRYDIFCGTSLVNSSVVSIRTAELSGFQASMSKAVTMGSKFEFRTAS